LSGTSLGGGPLNGGGSFLVLAMIAPPANQFARIL
jgi:hypothetical protein